jgi:hypothetical protein
LFRRTAVFRAHFGQGRKAWTPRRYRRQVENDQCEAQQIGAQGTPFLVIDGRYTVPGAICTDDLRRPDQRRPDQPVLRDARKRWSRMGCRPYRRLRVRPEGCLTPRYRRATLAMTARLGDEYHERLALGASKARAAQ